MARLKKVEKKVEEKPEVKEDVKPVNGKSLNVMGITKKPKFEGVK